MNDATKGDIIFYPSIDERREQQLEPSVEILSQCGSHYFFSPGFKTSDIILEHVIKKYSNDGKKHKGFFSSDRDSVTTCFDFSKKQKIMEEADQIRKEIFPDLALGDILACYKDAHYMYLLTGDELLSTYRDDNGEYLRTNIEEAFIDSNRIYGKNGMMISDDHDFSEEFQKLFFEIQLLKRDIKLVNCRHPMRNESLKVRKVYIDILIGKCLLDRYLSADEVVRMEILSRQLGVSSQTVLNSVSTISKLCRESRENDYIKNMVRKVSEIPREYYYVLFHDVIVFDLLSGCEIEKECISKYTDEISKRCNVDLDFKRKYIEAMQSFIKSTCDIRKRLEESKIRIQSAGIIEHFYDAIDVEYSVQQGMIRR